MAALGTIRRRGTILIIIIGLGLFAFIAEDVFRSCESTGNEKRQQVGEVLGKRISVQDFQAMVDEETDYLKFTQGRDNFTDEELNYIKDQTWQKLVSNRLIEADAEKLGLTVTDEEMQNILKAGTNPMLQNTPFRNPQTGRFDVTALTKFLSDYKSSATQQNPQAAEYYGKIYNYWKYTEKAIRQQLLAQKYQTLLASCVLSNPISAKMSFDAQNTESDILLASIPYQTVADKDVTVSDADIKAKYNERKELFKQPNETRDIKYVDFQVTPSAADRAALMKTMKQAQKDLTDGQAAADVVRKAQSEVAFNSLAVSKAALPQDIAAKVETMAVGQTTDVFTTESDNTLNVVKLMGKSQQPDSIEFCAIQVPPTTTLDAARATADSITKAIAAGADFATLAKKYQQEGKTQWLTSAMYESQPAVDPDSKAYIEALTTLGAGEVKNIAMSQGNIVLKVTQRKAMVDKYAVAVVKHKIEFSKETYSAAYNKFSEFVSKSLTVDDMEKNAPKAGYRVQEQRDFVNTAHNVANVRGTRDALKWVFEAKEGQVSPLYECGNNDHLLFVAMTKVHPEGYREATDKDLKEYLSTEVRRDKKFEKIAATYAAVKTIEEAQKKGAKIDTIRQITFAAPVFVAATGGSEPALCGAVAATAKGQMSAKPVKGTAGAYLFRVLDKKTNKSAKYDERQQELTAAQMGLQGLGRFMQELYMKANVVDRRYLFF